MEKMKQNEDHKRFYERALLPISLVLGIFFRVLWGRFWASSEYFQVWYGIFWLAYLGAFAWIHREKFRHNCDVMLSFAVCVVISGSLFIPTSRYDEMMLLTMCMIPLILMIQSQITTFPREAGRHQNLFLNCLLGFIIQPLSACNRFAGPFRAAFVRKRDDDQKSGAAFRIIIGLVCSIPIVTLVIYFLMRSDARFDMIMRRILRFIAEHLDIPNILLTCILVFIVAILFYSFFWNSRFSPNHAALRPVQKQFNVITISTILCVLLAVYLLFSVIQISYLFPGQGLPNDMSFATYARRGFAELIMVCVINLSIFSWVSVFVPDQRITRILLTIFLATTLIMAASSFTRLCLYVLEYDAFTFLRTLSMWFVLYIAAAVCLCVFRIFRPTLPLWQWLLNILLIWYGVLSVGYIPFMHVFG